MNKTLNAARKNQDDEWYTPAEAVNISSQVIDPIDIGLGFDCIWNPFDTKNSEYAKYSYKIACKYNLDQFVTHSDFFKHDLKMRQSCLVISNPPFSNKRQIIDRLIENNISFILLMPGWGLSHVWLSKLKDKVQIGLFPYTVAFNRKDGSNKRLLGNVIYLFYHAPIKYPGKVFWLPDNRHVKK